MVRLRLNLYGYMEELYDRLLLVLLIRVKVKGQCDMYMHTDYLGNFEVWKIMTALMKQLQTKRPELILQLTIMLQGNMERIDCR